MRRLPILLSFALVFALLVVAAAMAAPPSDKICESKPDHWTCTTIPPSSTTTTTTETPQIERCETNMTLDGKGRGGYECLWTPVNDGSPTGKVLFSNIEGVKSGVVIVRDDAPGDICIIEQGWGSKDGSTFEAAFDLVYGDELPGYDAWEEQNYWDFTYEADNLPTDPIVGAYWCAPQDSASDTIRLDTNGTPLHLRVGFNAGNGGHLDITLSPGQEPLFP